MSQTVLPNSINYNEQLPSISPSTQNFTQVLQPVNGAIFSQNQQIIIDMPSRGFIDPLSIYIRYKMTVATKTAAQQIVVLGCPLYAPFARVETFINSQQVDSIQDYNVVAHAWTNLFLGVNEKYGNQFGFAYNDSVNGVNTMDEMDGRDLGAIPVATPATYFASGPLVCTKLTACEKFIPAFATGGIRLILTLDTYANMLSYSNAAANFNDAGTFLSNFELVYDLIDFGPEVEQSILSQPSVMIKSNGYANSSVTVPVGANGGQTFVYNQRFASIRSAIALPSATAVSATFTSGKFDAIDITSGGHYSINVGGVTFPQGAPISFGQNKAGAMSELRKATGNLYDWSKSMAINNVEFSYIENPAPTTITTVQPGKCYIGFDLNKINSASRNMLNGTSSQNSPINLNLNFVQPSLSTKNIYLILNYDCVFILDPRTKMITLNQ